MFFTARIERPPLYRGGSASKKNGLPVPLHLSEAARCASKGIVPATPPLFFSVLLPFAQLHRQRFPRKDAVKIGVAVRCGGDEFNGFVDADRRATAG